MSYKDCFLQNGLNQCSFVLFHKIPDLILRLLDAINTLNYIIFPFSNSCIFQEMENIERMVIVLTLHINEFSQSINFSIC